MNAEQAHEDILNIISHSGNKIKTTVKYHYTPTTMAIMKKTDHTKRSGGRGKRGPIQCW